MPINRIRKIQDTTSNLGKAERYLTFSAPFMRFMVRNYSISTLPELSPDNIAKKYYLKGITFGNYVTQEERYYFLFKISKQLEALAKIKGSNNLGKNLLILAFGVEGIPSANAHFSPTKLLINLARGKNSSYTDILKGEQSFIHEYGHFIDFIQGHSDPNMIYQFASEDFEQKSKSPKTKRYSKVTKLIKSDSEYMGKLNTEYLRKKIEIFARLFEASITHHVQDKMKTYAPYFERTYKDYRYYPKEKLKKQGIISEVLKIVKEA